MLKILECSKSLCECILVNAVFNNEFVLLLFLNVWLEIWQPWGRTINLTYIEWSAKAEIWTEYLLALFMIKSTWNHVRKLANIFGQVWHTGYSTQSLKIPDTKSCGQTQKLMLSS